MKEKKKLFCIEVSDILEPEQEDFVIEKVKGYLNKDSGELKDYFKTTDTLKVKKLSKEEANNLSRELSEVDVSINVYNTQEKKMKEESSRVKCPKCGHVLEYPEWRCPECYYEFPDYSFDSDLEKDEDNADSGKDNK